MTISSKLFFAISCLTFLFCSCKKQIPTCSGNCTNVNFSGFMYDKSLNVPLSNQNVNIVLHQNSSCVICSSNIVASGKSDINGHFSITATFDTSLLSEYYIKVIATATENFIYYPQAVGPGITNSPAMTSSQFGTIDTVAFKNLSFDFYPRVLLKINLHRISLPVPQYPYLDQSYTFDGHTLGWGLDERPSNIDTTLTIYTSANIFTKIVSSKQQTPANVIRRVDSIKCTINGNNFIDIAY